VTTAQQYLDEQRRFLGVVGTGPRGNHTTFGAFTGHQDKAWCGSFQIFCAHAIGLELPGRVNPLTVATRQGFAEYERNGRSGTVPRIGAHVFYDWSGKDDPQNIHHIECVESLLPHGRFYTIGGNVDSKVQRVRRTMRFVVGFGYPVYSDQPSPRPVADKALPTVSLGQLIRAAKIDPGAAQGHQTSPADVRVVEDALLAEGLFDADDVTFAHDGSFGSATQDAYQKWQQRCGFHGKDADGIPGTQSLTMLGRKRGFRAVG
jgi:hypothetical protein